MNRESLANEEGGSSPSNAFAEISIDSGSMSTSEVGESQSQRKIVSPGRTLGARSASPAKRSAADMEGSEGDGTVHSVRAETSLPGSFPAQGEPTNSRNSDFDEAMKGMTNGGGVNITEDGSMDTSGDSSSTAKSSATSFESDALLPQYSAVDHSQLTIRADGNYTAEDIDQQETMVKLKQLKDLEEGQKGVLVSLAWLQRVLSRTSAGLKDSSFPKEAREGPIGPVDNSDIMPDDALIEPILSDIENRSFIPLKPGLVRDSDFVILNDDAWGVVVSCYGFKHGQKQIERYIRNTAGDQASSPHLQYELYPPIFKIRKIPQPKQDDEEETKPSSVPTSLRAASEKAEQRARGQMSPDDVVQLVSSRQEKFQKFLARSKVAAGIKRTTKVRILKALKPENIDVDSQQTVISSQAAATADSSDGHDKLVLSLDEFAKMDPGKDYEYLRANDETNNPNYNGKSDMETYILTENATLLLEEQVQGPGGGEFASDKKKNSNKLGLSLVGSKPGSTTNSGRTSPAPGAGIMTRGRTRRDGRARGTVGLTNLGNTCYMNSALQCIRSCEELAVYFLSESYKADINASNPLGHRGAMAKQYASLLARMYTDSNTSVVTPSEFKKLLGGIAPMFCGYGQQDSQEFLSFLVDALHEDLNRIQKKPYNENPDSNDETPKDPQKIIELGEIYRQNHRARNDSVAMDLFGGFYKNTMECPKCDKISITFDPFSLLTVQLPNEGSFQHPVTFVPLVGRPINHAIDCDKGATIKMLKEHVASKHAGVTADRLWMVEIYSHKLFRTFDNSLVLAEASIQSADHLFIFELDAVPLNSPSPEKKIYSSSMFGSNSRSDDHVPSMDDPKADCFAVPVFSRQKTRNGMSWEITLHPMYITLTRDEAQNYEVILKKVLIAVSRMTSRDVLNEMSEDVDDAESDKGEVAKHIDDAGTVTEDKVNDTSGSEDGYVRVSLPSGPQEAPNGVQKEEDHQRLPARFMDPQYFLSPTLSNSLFALGYAQSADSNMHCASMGSIKEHVKSLLARVKKPSRRSSEQSEASEESTTSTGSGEQVNRDEDASDSGVSEMDDGPDIVLGGDTGMGDLENADQSDDEQLPANPLQGMPISRKGRRKDNKGKKNRRNQKTYGGKNKRGYLSNKNNNRFPSAASKLNQSSEDDDENPYYIKLGEGLVLDWFPEALDGLFNGNPDDGEDLRGSFVSHHDGKGIPFLVDAEHEQKQARREARRKHGMTLTECFAETGKREVLSEDNAWYCSRCKELRRATKTLEIWTCPDILVVHLKRFGGNRSFRDKIDTLVDYPLEGLEMGPKIGLKEGGRTDEDYVYDLFAVDNHYGGLGGGHYTAYAKNFWDGQWYDYNDTHCSRVSEVKVQTSSAAYLLFYRRRSTTPLGPQYLQDLVNQWRSPASVTDAPADEGGEEFDSGEGRLGGPNRFLHGPSSAGTGAGVEGNLHRMDGSGGAGVLVVAGNNLTTMRNQSSDALQIEGRPVFGPQVPSAWNFDGLTSLEQQDGGSSQSLMVSVETGMDDDADGDSTTAQQDNDTDPAINSGWSPSPSGDWATYGPSSAVSSVGYDQSNLEGDTDMTGYGGVDYDEGMADLSDSEPAGPNFEGHGKLD